MIHKHLATLFVLTGLAAGSARAQVSCEPGQNGVIPCPCANNPSGSGRGCNNSLNTGGAALSATGSPSLSADNIQFHYTGIGTLSPSCSNPNGNVLCGLYEATLPISTGTVWNDGVICCTGTFYPLNIQVSSAGVYHWPVPGTTAVSSTAISMGDALGVGSTRYYFLAYRDTCPSFCTPNLRNKSNSWTLTWTP